LAQTRGKTQPTSGLAQFAEACIMPRLINAMEWQLRIQGRTVLAGFMRLIGIDNKPIAGSCVLAGGDGWIEISATHHSVRLPTDAKGLPNGRRVHFPVRVQKLVDRVSPRLFQALSLAEVFPKVELDFYRENKDGKQERYYSLILIKAQIAQINQMMGLEHTRTGLGEQVSFLYENIERVYHQGGIESHDQANDKPQAVEGTQSLVGKKDKQAKVLPAKHFLRLEIKKHADATLDDNQPITLLAYNRTQKKVSIKEARPVSDVLESSAFSADENDDIDLFAIFADMEEVFHDLKVNKSLDDSIKRQYIDPLVIKKSRENGMIVHAATLHLGPDMRIAIFFDGTGNDDSDPEQFSNVKKLFDLLDLDRKKQSNFTAGYYYRGVGSDGDGVVFGIYNSVTGSGIDKRLSGAVYGIERSISEYLEENSTTPRSINLDVFGFSRGATTARHFINIIKQGFYAFNDDKLQARVKPEHFNISFAGLFDSVGSYGIAGDNDDYGYNFHIKPEWLSGQAVHLVALNEYRAYFDLQKLIPKQDDDWPEDIQDGPLLELGLPGAHADVGGGYKAGEHGIALHGDEQMQKPLAQLSSVALDKMYDYALQAGVPLRPKDWQLDNDLMSIYDPVYIAIRDQKVRKHWMMWSAYRVQYEVHLKLIGKDNIYSHIDSPIPSQLQSYQASLEHEKENLSRLLGDDQAASLIAASDKLWDDYIHRSHAPFNTTPGSAFEREGAEQKFRPHRDIFFKEAVDFKQRNKELDRISKVRSRGKRIDIDEFEIIPSQEFKSERHE
jgi:type VI secretion system secreted protein Hcp